MDIVDLARTIAIRQHADATSKHDGELYLLHVNRVAVGARSQAAVFDVDPSLAEAVGWLHDVVEDTDMTLVQLEIEMIEADVEPEVISAVLEAVRKITKVGGERYEDYVRSCRINPLARAVKMSDMLDNFSRNHRVEDVDTRLRLGRKYSRGLELLKP